MMWKWATIQPWWIFYFIWISVYIDVHTYKYKTSCVRYTYFPPFRPKQTNRKSDVIMEICNGTLGLLRAMKSFSLCWTAESFHQINIWSCHNNAVEKLYFWCLDDMCAHFFSSSSSLFRKSDWSSAFV